MEKDAFYIHKYIKYLACASLLCALIEFAFLVAFRSSVFTGVLSTEDKILLGVYAFLILAFAAVAIGVWNAQHWAHSAMVVLCTLGSLLLITIFIAGIFMGGFLQGLDAIVGAALQPAYATTLSKEIMLLLLPFLLLFNPFNLYLFTKHVKVKSLFVPQQKEAVALKRKEY
jgi:hypothetical protein